MLDTIFYIILPYVAFFSMITVSILRYRTNQFSYSSLSSQFLEAKQLFWGSNPFHFGLIIVLGGHILGFLIPNAIITFNAHPLRLLLLEITGLGGGLLMAFGFAVLFFRRLSNPKIRVVTSPMDRVLLLLLAIQIFTGLYTAIFLRWGSSWYASALVPYLRSLFVFQPAVGYLTGLPFLAKLHIINAFILIGVLPFTRLVHLFSYPFKYIFRPYQVVRWNWNRKTIRG